MKDSDDAEEGRSLLEQAVGFLRQRLDRAPRAVLVLGSGLGSVADEVRDGVSIPYAEIPGFPTTSVAGHPGRLVVGTWSGVDVAVMSGRFHLYEGCPPRAATRPIRVLEALGADHLMVTNAAGGIRSDMRAGDLMLIADHINLMHRNPLIGPTGRGEERFPDMSDPYDHELREVALRTAKELGVRLVPGVYAAVLGPSYETPAEVRALSRLGADAVGMSTVPEVLVARAIGMRVLGISCITNVAAGISPRALEHGEVLKMASHVSDQMVAFLRAALPRLVSQNLPRKGAK